MTGDEIKVLIADDHEIVRSGVRMLIDVESDMSVVGEAADGNEAVTMAKQLRPDVVVMDISMPDLTGIEATKAMQASSPEVHVVGLTMHSDERYFFELLKAGASGYVVKGGAPHELIDAIRAAAQGKAYIHPSLAGKLISGYVQQSASSGGSAATGSLTEREQEILQLIAGGLTSRQIADKLIISINTVERHRSNIMTKLDLHNKAELVKYAFQKGLITPD